MPTTKTTCLGLLAALTLIAPSLFAREEFTRTFDKTATLSAGQALLVEHRMGSIVIHTHPQPQLVVHAEIHTSASDRSHAEQFAQQVQIQMESSATEYSIRTRYPENQQSFFGFNNVSYSVHYEITMPETTRLTLHNSFGAVTVIGLNANGDIRSSHGALTVSDTKGTQRLENAFASVSLSHNSGDISIENTNGEVKVSDVSGTATVRDRFAAVRVERVRKDLTIVNTNGAVEVTDCGGAANIHNAFAAVEVHQVKQGLVLRNNNGAVTVSHVGGAASVQNSFGPVELTDIGGKTGVESQNGAVDLSSVHGDAQVKTSFAAVTLQQIAGAVHVENQNGAVEVSRDSQARDCQPLLVHTSFAPIRVRLGSSSSYRVSANTSFGKITTDFPLTVSGSISSDQVNGTIGDGRCQLELSDRNGSIQILK